MININKKALVGLLLSILTLISPVFLGVNFAQPPTIMYVDPPNLSIPLGTQFTIDIKVLAVNNLYAFEFWLSYDTNFLDAIDVVNGSFLNPPSHVVIKNINDTAGYINFGWTSISPAPPANGDGTLATITFTCTASGKTPLHLYSTSLFDFLNNPILHGTIDGTVTQIPPWFVKPAFPDYAPSGMPDFDQKQDNWIYPIAGYTWCGPVAIANSLWWLDSEYESILNPNPVPPPTYSDKFPLVQPYGPWDDHDLRNVVPLVNSLSFLMDTDGKRTNLTHSGTFFNDMQVGISQYLQKQGVNPIGDCDGNGAVDYKDLIIVKNAFNSMPGAPNWNLAADLVPDGVINSLDLLAVQSHLGQVGTFNEHTEEFPNFPWIEQEVYTCEDVVLLLEFWQDMGGGTWSRYMYDPGGQAGHYITIAGVNSTTSQLLISDPWSDAFEAKKAPGESPIPHPYPHDSSIHNDAQFVSHDAYMAMPWMLPQPTPYPTPVWELGGYLQALGWDPSWHAFIRAAVVTSPITVAVSDVKNSKEPCDPMPTIGQPNYTASISATFTNKASTPQTFTATAYANGTAIGATTITSLLPNATINVNVTIWNTTGWAYGDYFITVGTDASYQDFTSSTAIRVTIPGDITRGLITGDWMVDIYDAIEFAGHINTRIGGPNFSPNADINGDGIDDIYDAILLANNYNRSIPPP